MPRHYCPEEMNECEQLLLGKAHLTGPTFVGQGLTKRCGSDSYGMFIVAKKVVGKKTIWGIAAANSEMIRDWTDGEMSCVLDIKHTEPQFWIMPWGKTKTGACKWWKCDAEGKRFKGERFSCSWDGAFAYRDPSF